jgi:hypothetical protein
LHSKTQKDNFDLGAKLLSEKMSDINIEASFSDGEFAQKHIARRVGFLRCRHLSKQVVATPIIINFPVFFGKLLTKDKKHTIIGLYRQDNWTNS